MIDFFKKKLFNSLCMHETRQYNSQLANGCLVILIFCRVPHEGTVDADVFVEFLRRLMLGAKQPGRLKRVYLPPYSPQLNPDEQVCAYVKTRVAKKLPQNKAQVKTYLKAVLKRLNKLPYIVRSFSRHPDCK